MKFSKMFITGCDKNTEWMLPWFVDNYRFWNDLPLMIFDFGMTPEVSSLYNAVPLKSLQKGWFKKPAAMIEASKRADSVCWLDTDCHVLANIEKIFSYIEPNKLLMAEDRPWSTRRKEVWHNSGVVAFSGRPSILDEWNAAIKNNPVQGDQEVLHLLMREGMRRSIYITDLPRRFNTLRLDVLDNTVPANIKIMHWTGQKGKDKIREMANV